MCERHPRRLLYLVFGLVAACQSGRGKGDDSDQALYERGLLAAERGAYEQALLLRARLSPKSSYYRRAIGEPRYLHAAKVYRARARTQIEALMGTGQCAAAQQALRGALHLVRHWRTMEARLRDCHPATGTPTSLPQPAGLGTEERLVKRVLEAYVDEDYRRAFTLGERYLAQARGSADERLLTIVAAAACKIGRPERARAIAPRLSLPRLAVVHRACDTLPATLPTKPDAGCDPEIGSRCVQAYLGNNWLRALVLGQRYLRCAPGDQKVLAVVGASACKLGRAKIAKALYRRLNPARRGMLAQVCSASKIDVTTP